MRGRGTCEQHQPRGSPPLNQQEVLGPGRPCSGERQRGEGCGSGPCSPWGQSASVVPVSLFKATEEEERMTAARTSPGPPPALTVKAQWLGAHFVPAGPRIPAQPLPGLLPSLGSLSRANCGLLWAGGHCPVAFLWFGVLSTAPESPLRLSSASWAHRTQMEDAGALFPSHLGVNKSGLSESGCGLLQVAGRAQVQSPGR